ncbi:DMT family transporter [Aeromonas enteropelogenes]|uniref:DMT family transporter n=1 Tax=Aeromonas enteropelogenes TaxID=29489 RepID=UPI0009E5EBFC|nr:DMT family transporter [Aeromonas enteropelogenes]UBH51366.1 DMT family transporter [Aeromonas enteropelogenes]
MKKRLFISVCLIWGTTWLAMAIAGQSIPSLTATALRFMVMSPLLILIACKDNVPLLFPRGKRHYMPIVALFYFAIPFWFMLEGEKYISSGLAAIIFSYMPIAIMLLSYFITKQHFSLRQIQALLVTLLSLVSIISIESDISGSNYLIGIVLLTSAVLLHAIIYILKQHRLGHIHVLTFSAIPSGIASLLLLMAGLVTEPLVFADMQLSSLLAVLYLGSIAGVGGIVAYFRLNALVSPFKASLCFLIFPVIAVALEAVVTGRSLSPYSLLFILPLAGGIYQLIKPKREAPKTISVKQGAN